MSFNAAIKELFTNEIIGSPQYQVALKIKDLIINDIILDFKLARNIHQKKEDGFDFEFST